MVLDGTQGVAGAVGSIMARTGSKAASMTKECLTNFMLEVVFSEKCLMRTFDVDAVKVTLDQPVLRLR